MTPLATAFLLVTLSNISGAHAYSCYGNYYYSTYCGPRYGYAYPAAFGILAFFSIIIIIWICIHRRHTKDWQKVYVEDAEARAATMQQTRTTYSQPSIPMPKPVHQNMTYTYDINNSGNQTQGSTAGGRLH